MTGKRAEILVIGHRGMLGQDLMARLGARAAGADREECDVTRRDAVEALLDELKPATIINCAAYTAVDQAESEPELARSLNADAVENLGLAARARRIHLITISTDYVFSGEGEAPWPEDAPASAFAPRSIYGQTKLEGEQRLRRIGGEFCVVRTQWLYGAGGRNFVDTMAALSAEKPVLRVVNDQLGAPTWTRDLADALTLLAERRATGFFHVANSGFASWYDVTRHIVQRLGRACRVEPCTSEEFPRPARRPHNSRLAQGKFAALAGSAPRPWPAALDAYLSERHGRNTDGNPTFS
ncbi:MAG TPA: dTDP-4-dehydrorhamnose reductase [Candidatus Sumerlaeota bacterium]|nr:dTDP-4-dehydrorhamnose reductase [Candidatus Sumerlaeota bacterium]